jgi:molybdopterin converting factor small subunit
VVTKSVVQFPVTAEEKASAVTVHLFAGAADGAARRTVHLPVHGTLTIGDTVLRLCHVFPELNEMAGRILFAANGDYAGPDCVLRAGDELVLVPAFSGGANN